MIHVCGLQVDIEDGPAVRGVDLTVPPGAVVGIIGPRGSGKTSLLRAIAGLVEPSDGAITLGTGEGNAHDREDRPVIGYMPAQPALYPELRAWECLDVMAAAYPFSRTDRRERIHAVLESVGLRGRWDQPVRELFARERVLLAFALAILPLPEVLLLDAPAEDAPSADLVRLGRLITAEAKRGAAVLIACENLTRWEGVCDGVLVLEQGRVITRGETGELRRRAGVTGHVIVRLADHSAAQEALLGHILRGSPLVHEVHEDEKGAWVAAYLGGHKQAAALLSALIAAGLTVSGFHFKADSAASGPPLDYSGEERERLTAP